MKECVLDMSMTIRIFDTVRDAGIYVATITEAVIVGNQSPVLGLATGDTPTAFYQALINLHRCGLDLSQVTTVNLDEYVGLDANHPQSYHYFMQMHLFSQTNLSSQNTFIPNGAAPNLIQECARYDEILKAHAIDLQILGVGVNGHIGFNEPADMLLTNTHVVTLREETIASNARFFDRTEAVPRQAITMGIQSILQSKRIVLMAFGAEKADIVARIATGNVSTNIPVSILQLHQNVVLVLDRESARQLVDNYGEVNVQE